MKKKSLKKSGRKKISGVNVVGYLFCGLIALVCLIPFIMVLAASFTSEEAISLYGFSLWPKEFSLEAYKAVFKSPAVVAKARTGTNRNRRRAAYPVRLRPEWPCLRRGSG